MTGAIARMATGVPAPFQVGDRVTAVTKTGAATHVRGTVHLVHEPLDSAWTGGVDVDPWEFDVTWDDSGARRYCARCGSEERVDAQSHGGGLSAVVGVGQAPPSGASAGNCCGHARLWKAGRSARVTEHEIKKLTAVDLIAELDREG